MQDLFGSVRRSLVFRPNSSAEDGGGTAGRLAEKIGSCLRKSRVIGLGLGFGFPPKLPGPPPCPVPAQTPPIRWRKGELIGCGAFGHVYMGMNLDSGELLAVKQVLIGTNNASKERAQAHIRDLEEEVKLLKNLSHLNIVRYLGTAREEETLNILMEFVPGGSISSLLGKFGSFPESVIRMYTKQLLLGLDYLHTNGIMHRDIKGANILVDNKGCIKLADFGASKQVAKLATITAAKSMKGTPYWMAPEVILQTGHSFSADIWSVGCTVIEMATGKPPWSQQFQEVAALFHIGTTKSHPPIPEHLSPEAKDFLLKCLQKEPSMRATSSELLQHPFVIGEIQDTHHRATGSSANALQNAAPSSGNSLMSPSTAVDRTNVIDDFSCGSAEKLFNARPIWGPSCSNDDLCQLDDKDDFLNVGSSFNPMSEPVDDWPCKFDISPEQQCMDSKVINGSINAVASTSENINDFTFPCGPNCEDEDEEVTETKIRAFLDSKVINGSINAVASTSENIDDFTFPCGPNCEDEDEEVTETKIRAFLDEKALDLKKLQSPLYEFYNTLNASSSPVVGDAPEENVVNNTKLPPKSKLSPGKRRLSMLPPLEPDPANTSPVNASSRRMSSYCGENDRILREIPSPKFNELSALLPDTQNEKISPSFCERRRKWKEELDQELQRNRELMRQAGVGGKVSSPKERCPNQRRERLCFGSPAK